MQPRPLIIWTNSPPFVEQGAFEYLEEHWPGGVSYAILGELRAERVRMGWGDKSAPSRAIVEHRGAMSIEHFCAKILRNYPDGLHLVAGLSSTTGHALAEIVRSTPAEQVVVFSERPGAYGPLARRLVSHVAIPLKYAWLVRRYRHRVGLLLPLGLAGARRFVRYGWPQERVAPFMYCPQTHEDSAKPVQVSGRPLRFLYVGRLSRFTKGTDILLDAADHLCGDWSLTLVGGHGDLVATAKEWARGKQNVHLSGALTPREVSKVIAEHDVCVVPSRFDGWNVVVNEALQAGRGVITTDEAVSHEMIDVSGAGTVIKARSARRLAEAMQQVIDNPMLVNQWSKRALDYIPQISPLSVGQYTVDLLQTFTTRPPHGSLNAPWLHRTDLNK